MVLDLPPDLVADLVVDLFEDLLTDFAATLATGFAAGFLLELALLTCFGLLLFLLGIALYFWLSNWDL